MTCPAAGGIVQPQLAAEPDREVGMLGSASHRSLAQADGHGQYLDHRVLALPRLAQQARRLHRRRGLVGEGGHRRHVALAQAGSDHGDGADHPIAGYQGRRDRGPHAQGAAQLTGLFHTVRADVVRCPLHDRLGIAEEVRPPAFADEPEHGQLAEGIDAAERRQRQVFGAAGGDLSVDHHQALAVLGHQEEEGADTRLRQAAAHRLEDGLLVDQLDGLQAGFAERLEKDTAAVGVAGGRGGGRDRAPEL